MMWKTIACEVLFVAIVLCQPVQADEGVVNGPPGYGKTELEACQQAKKNSDNQVLRGNHVTGHSDCDCAQNDLTKTWTCTVETKWKTNGS